MPPAEVQPPELDPRVFFAAERTLLAWIRTGLAMMGFGFVVARFGLFLREFTPTDQAAGSSNGGLSLWMGTGLILLGVAVTIGAAYEHVQDLQRMRRGDPPHPRRLLVVVLVATALAALGLVMAGYLVAIR